MVLGVGGTRHESFVAGIVTIFAIVAGCVGANLHPSKVVIIGIGNLLADAISMGFGEFVSSAAEEDFVKSEREREEWYLTAFYRPLHCRDLVKNCMHRIHCSSLP